MKTWTLGVLVDHANLANGEIFAFSRGGAMHIALKGSWDVPDGRKTPFTLILKSGLPTQVPHSAIQWGQSFGSPVLHLPEAMICTDGSLSSLAQNIGADAPGTVSLFDGGMAISGIDETHKYFWIDLGSGVQAKNLPADAPRYSKWKITHPLPGDGIETIFEYEVPALRPA